LLVLHGGRLLANDRAFVVVSDKGAVDVGDAFARLTGIGRPDDPLQQVQ
jgi:hypothetical protein